MAMPVSLSLSFSLSFCLVFFTGTELEFGLVFPNELSASSFNQQLVMRLCSIAFVEIQSSPCVLEEYDRLATAWRTVEAQAEAQIREKQNCSEAFLLVFKYPIDSSSTPASTAISSNSSSSNSSSGSSSGGGAAGNGGGKGKGGRGNNNTSNSNSSSSSSSSSNGRKNSIALETVAAAAAGAAAAGAAAGAAAAAAGVEGEPAAAEAAEAAAAAATAAAEAAAATAAAAVTVTLPLCYIRISQDEFIFPLPEQQELQWWGASPDGEKRLYRIKFTAAAAAAAAGDAAAADQQQQQQAAAAAAAKRFLDLYQLTLAEVTSKCRLSPQVDIDKQMGYAGKFETFAKDDEREGMQIDDADSDPSDDEEQFPVVSRDPTRDLLRSSPNAMINELLEAGSKQSVVFRVGAGAPGASLDRRDMQVLR
ncbi:hypothetical protein Emag_001321 [Eimeria magna]